MLLDFNNLKEKYSLKINGILHIGAHYGEEYEVYKQNNIEKLIFFEPAPDNFKILKELLNEKVVLVNKALGNKNTKILLNVESANQGQSNSILKPLLHLKQYPHITFDNTVEIDMVRLDDYMQENNLFDSGINFINIDVQGYELEVFKGAENYLNNVDYIVTEVNRDIVYYDNVLIEDLDNYLSKYNFKRFDTTWDGGIWGDAFYIKIK
jgi:FkbM family methyltransferase